MRKLIFILAAVLLVGYGLFEARRLLEGPVLSIDTPSNGSATSSVTVTVTGTAQNISFLTINDRPALTDEEGHFHEMLTPPPGYTIVTVAATDRFGRKAAKSVSITMLNFCPNRQS